MNPDDIERAARNLLDHRDRGQSGRTSVHVQQSLPANTSR